MLCPISLVLPTPALPFLLSLSHATTDILQRHDLPEAPPFLCPSPSPLPPLCRRAACLAGVLQRHNLPEASHTRPSPSLPPPPLLLAGVLLALAGILQRHDFEAPPGKARGDKSGGDALSAAIIGLSHLSDGDSPTQALLMQVWMERGGRREGMQFMTHIHFPGTPALL